MAFLCKGFAKGLWNSFDLQKNPLKVDEGDFFNS
jgi:hypothetical protein